VIAGLIGFVLSFAAAFAVGLRERSIAEMEFAAAAQRHAMALQNGVNEYVSRLKALRTFFETAGDKITRSEFELLGARLFGDHPGLLRVTWAPRVTRKERATYEAAAVADGLVDYKFQSMSSEGALAPAPESDEYFPVFYSTEPRTSLVYGHDLVSEPSGRVTLERARDNDVTAGLPRVAMLLDFKMRPATFVAVPVYATGASRDTVAERRRNIRGFIVGTLEMQPLLEAARSLAAPSGIKIEVNEPASGINGLEGAPNARSLTGPRWSGLLNIADAGWNILLTPVTDGSLIANHVRALAVLICGIVVTVILIAYLCLASRHAGRLEIASRQALELAQTDALTGLANRSAFFDHLRKALGEKRPTGWTFSFLYFDLDNFKDANDTFGHSFGDELLRQVAHRLRATVPQGDLVARFGGDEFAVLQPNVPDSEPADMLAQQIAKALAEPYKINDSVVHVTASIGVARHTPDLADADAMMMQADLALYRAKQEGRSCCRLHSVELGQQVRERITIAEELRSAIARGELELNYQPQVELLTSRIIGLEALLRWRHPLRGMVSPAQFVPIAERNGNILELGRWAFEEACRQYRAWMDEGIAPNVVAVNLSAAQFKLATDILGDITKSLERWEIAPQRLEVELTESVFIEVNARSNKYLERLRSSGIRLALDDFGIGYSSLSYLASYPIDRLKIAQQLMLGVPTDARNAVIIRTAIRLARDLGVEFIAEGVETQSQTNFLLSAGCQQAQGFHFSRPVSAARATELLREGRINFATLRNPKVRTVA